MKKILLFTLMTATLAGCSKFNAFIDKFYYSDNSIKVNPDDNLDNPDQDSEVVTENKPTSTLKLKYKAATHEIDARIITNWNGAPQGTIYLTWIAPKDTSCYSTSFPITKFNETQDYTVDSQSVLSDYKVCDGTWTAMVVNKSDNSELAKASFEVK